MQYGIHFRFLSQDIKYWKNELCNANLDFVFLLGNFLCLNFTFRTLIILHDALSKTLIKYEKNHLNMMNNGIEIEEMSHEISWIKLLL